MLVSNQKLLNCLSI